MNTRSAIVVGTWALATASCIVEAPGSTGRAGGGGAVVPAAPVAANLPPLQVPLRANFEDKVELVGTVVTPGRILPGEAARVTLQLRILGQLQDDYMIFVHAEDVDGKVERMNIDHRPSSGPTTAWKPGDIVKDEFQVYVPPGVPIRGINLWGGFWHPVTDTRLKLKNTNEVRNDGSNRILFATIPVGL